MEYCDFSVVMSIIRKYVDEGRTMNQVDLLYQVFDSFLADNSASDFVFDNGLVCRWFNGQAKVSPRISGFYIDKKNQKELVKDIELNVIPLLYDSGMATQEIHDVLIQDVTISEKMKKKLCKNYPCKTETDEAKFLAEVLQFSMERNFVRRDAGTKKLMAAGTFSPMIRDYILNSSLPKPCQHFCGRDRELVALHELLSKHGKVFLQGIPGIGKSELAKAYASHYKKAYTNVLYLVYSGDLKRDIVEMDFADDFTEDGDEERFRKHNRFLRTLKEDTLLIIDNFNTTAIGDALLPVVMKYRCRILFTTRSHFENETELWLEEISEKDALVKLMGCFYSEAHKYPTVMKEIVETVHSHTLAVELAARLLEVGILEPGALLNKLREKRTALDASDKIGIRKDGANRKATYYEHIHTLFALCNLSKAEMDLMCNLSMIPAVGISGKLFAKWMKLPNLNTVNDLIEKGFVRVQEGHVIALHPMIQEVVIEETKPSVQKCRILLESMREICLRHGEEIPYYRRLFQTVENVICSAFKDDQVAYLRFLEDVFPYMEKYRYIQGMELILKELTGMLGEQGIGTISDRALFLDYRAACEKNLNKAIKLEKEAVALLAEITSDHALLASNLYANLGGLYKQNGNLEQAKQAMEEGIRILNEYGLAPYHDSVAQITNYAVLLTDMGQAENGMAALQKLAEMVKNYNSDMSMDYACVQEALGGIHLFSGDVQKAVRCFRKALKIYENIFEMEPEILEGKQREMTAMCERVGVYLMEKG